MKTHRNDWRRLVGGASLLSLLFSLVTAPSLRAADEAQAKPAGAVGDMVPLILKLPDPAFKGTHKDIPLGPNIEPLSDKPRPPMMVPTGLKNIAPGTKLTSSDKNATADTLAKLTDGDK